MNKVGMGEVLVFVGTGMAIWALSGLFDMYKHVPEPKEQHITNDYWQESSDRAGLRCILFLHKHNSLNGESFHLCMFAKGYSI